MKKEKADSKAEVLLMPQGLLPAAAPLFDGWEESMISACLQGIMGEVYAVGEEKPVSAAAVLGDFCFLAGKPEKKLILCDYFRSFLILVPQNEEWAGLLESTLADRAVKRTRYAIRREPDCFDPERLEALCSLPAGYTLCGIDGNLYEKCGEEDWSRDLVACFPDREAYLELGLGYVACKDGRIVAGASSYSRCREGIEVEVDTREDCRRMGLACACSAALILECLRRGLYPGWDAQNLYSLSLAEKLGYHFSHSYPVFEYRKPE